MSGTRAAVILGLIPLAVGLLYLGMQLAFGSEASWWLVDGKFFDDEGDIVAKLSGNIDPAGVILLGAFGVAMGFGFLVILRGARDL